MMNEKDSILCIDDEEMIRITIGDLSLILPQKKSAQGREWGFPWSMALRSVTGEAFAPLP